MIISMTIVCSYIIFGMVGFGTALIASPVLLHFLPLSQIIPLLAILDMFSALLNVMKDGRKPDLLELKRLVPFMLIGSSLGLWVLFNINADYALLAFAIFTMIYALYALSGLKPISTLKPISAIPFGFSGGFLGAMFGSGGFLYAIYLNARIDQPEKIRVTQTTLIGCSTVFRVLLFTIAGVYFTEQFVSMIIVCIPFMILGTTLGRHITLKLSKSQFLKIIHIIILCSGFSLLIKYILST